MKTYALSTFLFKSIIEDVPQNASSGLLDDEVELLTENRVFDSEYADGIVLLYDNAQTIHRALSPLAIDISRYAR